MTATLTADRLWSLPRVGNPSAAAGTLVVPVTEYDLDENRGTTRLWLVRPGSDPFCLTPGPSGGRKPVVSPGGRHLAFLRSVDGIDQVHVMPVDGGEARPLTDLPLGALGCVWFPDGGDLVVVAPLLHGHLSISSTVEELARRKQDKTNFHATEDAVYRYWDRWLTDGRRPHLFRVTADGDTTDLTPDWDMWMAFDNTAEPLDDVAVSPDGAEVAVCADRSDPPHRELRWSLFTIDVTDLSSRELTPGHEGHIHRPRYSPDGRWLVYGRTDEPHFYAAPVSLDRLDRATGAVTTLLPDWDRSPVDWCYDGDRLVIGAEDQAGRPVFALEPDGALRTLASGGTFTGVVASDGEIYAAHGSLVEPPEVVAVSPEGPRVLTSFARPGLADLDAPTVEDIRFTGGAGDEVQMYLLTPPGMEGPGPLLHLIHGGPHSTFGDTWHWRWNAIALSGGSRRVAMVNFHGSTSFGDAYTRSIRGAWADLPTHDIEAATDLLVERGIADPDHMAIAGGSYGGYMVAWLTTQTSRYRCAVAHAAVTSLPGMYASDVTAGRADAYGAEVFEDLDRVLRWSPLAHAAGLNTPTLVIHGDRDYRVPVTQGLELYGVLQAKGVPARLVHFPEQNHWVLSPADSLVWYREVAEWLGRHSV